ncbi:hypothetical protein EDD11_005823 [Mortierella claussenii]|nr:hypothetical protein EDD11_005823 [Mortierella claussenii]
MKFPTFISSIAAATFILSSSSSQSRNSVSAQHISHVISRVKVISDGGTTVGGYKHHHPQFQEPIIRSTDLMENLIENAYWIDFHDQFDQHSKFSDLVQHHPGITLRHEFWDVLNAVSISVRDEGVLKEILAQIPGIKLVEPVVKHDRPDYFESPIRTFAKTDSNPKKYKAHDLTGVKRVHDSLKLFGNGIKIGIIDSGVDYHHPALGGCFGPGCKVAYGTDFVGDDGKSPDDDPMTDCDGHGTHVAGIIAANDTSFIGVAPQDSVTVTGIATLGAYRVFGCKGGTSNDLIMKALLRAAGDGMQIINLSLGGPGGWYQEREARLADALAKNGTIIIAAMGNEGQMGLFESSSPGVAGTVITVASTENEFQSNNYFTIEPSSLKVESVETDEEPEKNGDDEESGKDEDDDSNQADQPRLILYVGDVNMDFRNATLVQVAPGTSGKVKEDACKPITTNLSGKIALIRRGDCIFKQKIANAALANATGVIIMDNVPSSGFAAEAEGATIPVRTITLSDGEFLLEAIKNQKKEVEGIKLVAGDEPKKVYNPNGGFLSIFSSMGPDSELNSKPDIAAPGGQIWSTFPIKVSERGIHVKGLPNGDHTANGIKTALQNSAQPRKLQTGYEGLASVTQQGAGLLNMMDVLKSQVVVTPSRIALNDTVNMNENQHITIANNGETPLHYEIDIVPAVGLLPFDKNMMVEKTPQQTEAEASVEISTKSITVASGSSVTVDLKFTGPDTDPSKYVIYSGYVRLTPETVSPESPVIHVPYMGMQGDYKKVNIMDPTFGLRVFDFRGRPLQVNSVADEHSKSSAHSSIGISGSISDEIDTDPDAAPGTGEHTDPTIPPPTTGGRPSGGMQSGMKVVFRLLTASEILVLDLVADKGDDPYQVKSYGVLKNGIARYVPRNDQVEGNAFQVIGWDGQILTEDGQTTTVADTVQDQNYRLRISLLKHFGNPENDQDFESYLSAPFSLN